ncbi:hypothetical protein Dsin_004644 [Dipteronia sinensis]|uniref:Uncharacterized protein n=1 Tax=Dipteronia sinensis TaxID=43782 RepID=A0AAE0EEF1_9ROSI|nr:hypothetical protein Dsin_004644 [Dipteronia sinensis]
MGQLKLNTDAAIDVVGRRTEIGVVIRDHSGFVMASSSQRIDVGYTVTPQLSQRWYLFFEVSISQQIQAWDLWLWSLMPWEFYLMSMLLRLFMLMVACGLAKYALTLDEDLFWMEEYPPCARDVVLADDHFVL